MKDSVLNDQVDTVSQHKRQRHNDVLLSFGKLTHAGYRLQLGGAQGEDNDTIIIATYSLYVYCTRKETDRKHISW